MRSEASPETLLVKRIIKRLRLESNMTMAEGAAFVGVSIQTLEKMEGNGRHSRRTFTLDELVAYANKYGVDLNFFTNRRNA